MASHANTLSKPIAISDKLRKVLELIPEHEQDQIAEKLSVIMAQEDVKWSEAFADSMAKLEKLKDEALQAYAFGETQVLDPEKL